MIDGKDLRPFREEILREMRMREQMGQPNGLDGMILDLAERYEIYPDDIIEKYKTKKYEFNK